MLDNGEKFQAAIDRLRAHLKKRCDAAKALTESMIQENHPRSELAGQQFLNSAEEYHAFTKLIQLVSVMASDLNEIIEKEKNNISECNVIEVVALPGAAKRSSSGEDMN